MAKTSKIAAQRRRETIVARYAEQRATLKEQARTGATLTERQQALRALSNLPREASPTRLRNRDVADGRPRGYIRKAGSPVSSSANSHFGENSQESRRAAGREGKGWVPTSYDAGTHPEWSQDITHVTVLRYESSLHLWIKQRDDAASRLVR